MLKGRYYIDKRHTQYLKPIDLTRNGIAKKPQALICKAILFILIAC